MASHRKKPRGRAGGVGVRPITIRPAYTRRAGKKKGDWYDESATYKPPQGQYRRDKK